MAKKNMYLIIVVLLYSMFCLGFSQGYNFSQDSIIIGDYNVRNMVTGDFNNDNYEDIAITMNNSIINNPVAVYLNNGTGIINNFPDSLYENSKMPFDLAAADFNNDNYLDIAYTLPVDSSIIIALGNGNGQFTITDSFKVLTESHVIECADINNDNNEDIIVATRYARMYVTNGNGDGTFNTPIEYISGGTSSDIELFDLNSDGFQDLIIGVGNTASMSIFLNDGTGNFPTKNNYYTYRTPGSVKACYFNMDSIPDFVVGSGSWDYDNLILMLGDTTGSYFLADTLSPGSNIANISVCDLDIDGYIDVLVGDRNGIYIVPGDSLDHFATADTIDLEINDYQVRDTETKDINNDGNPDLIIARNNKISIYYNHPIQSLIGESSQVESSFKLYQNYPNPFNPSTTIKYALPKSSEVKIEIFNILGQRMALLYNGFKQAGYHQIQFNADNLSSGIYYYSFYAGDFHQVRKMIILR